jgi:hypothetical protein
MPVANKMLLATIASLQQITLYYADSKFGMQVLYKRIWRVVVVDLLV